MKTELTIQESENLFALGIPKEKASKLFPTMYPLEQPHVFTLTDLLEILTKEIYADINCKFRMESWVVECTVIWDVQYVGIAESFIQNKELIDALYELACWYYGEYLKSEKK